MNLNGNFDGTTEFGEFEWSWNAFRIVKLQIWPGNPILSFHIMFFRVCSNFLDCDSFIYSELYTDIKKMNLQSSWQVNCLQSLQGEFNL